VYPRRLGAQGVPILDVAVSAAEPSQRNEVDLLIFGQGADKSAQLLGGRIVSVILENRDHRIVARIRPVIRIRDHVLGIEFMRLDHDEADLCGRESSRQFTNQFALLGPVCTSWTTSA
jgi:hypothetical protein